MRKSSITGLLTLLSIAGLLVACKDQPSTSDSGNQSSNNSELIIIDEGDDGRFSLDFTSKSLLIYTDFTISIYGGEVESAVWSSSNASVASVSDGLVIGLATGNTVVSVLVNDVDTLTCEVIVYDEHLEAYWVLNAPENKINLEVGDTFTLIPMISYNGETYTDGETRFSLEGSSVAISDDGIITALALGQSLITVSGSWRGNETMAPIVLEVNVV